MNTITQGFGYCSGFWLLLGFFGTKERKVLDDSSEPEKGEVLTLPETNIASENRPLEKEIPVGNHHF